MMSWPLDILRTPFSLATSRNPPKEVQVESVEWDGVSDAETVDVGTVNSTGRSTPTTVCDETEVQLEPIPIVLVQGFLGTAGVFSWEQHIYDHCSSSTDAKVRKRRKVLVPSLGPVSSLHDRACELFYYLVGGVVDYGAEHSATYKHARYGRRIPEGLYSQWSIDYPLHFVGHSIGGPTIIKLQHLLAQGFFGKEYHPDMILSVNAVCAPFRGTQLVYTLGESMTSAPDVRPISAGNIIGKFVHVLAYLGPLLPASFDVHADARQLSYKDVDPMAFLRHLWNTDWSRSRDAAPFDVTFESSDDREALGEGTVYPHTFYRSFVSVATGFTSSIMRNSDFDALVPRPSFCKDNHDVTSLPRPSDGKGISSPLPNALGEEYFANDGVAPLFSQWHPQPCSEAHCEHHSTSPEDADTLHPGIWNVLTIDDANHISLIPRPLIKPSNFQARFWAELLRWLDEIEGRSVSSHEYASESSNIGLGAHLGHNECVH